MKTIAIAYLVASALVLGITISVASAHLLTHVNQNVQVNKPVEMPAPVIDQTVDRPHAWMYEQVENVNSDDNTNQFDVAPCWPAEDQNNCGEDMNTNGAVPISPYDNRY